MTEKQLDLDLVELVEEAVRVYGDKLTNKTVVTDVVDFMLGRFRAAYQDEGIGADVVLAVLARRPTRPLDFDRRVKAVSHFRTLDAALALAAANKRVSNILARSKANCRLPSNRNCWSMPPRRRWPPRLPNCKPNWPAVRRR